MKMMSAPEIRLVDNNFSERIISKYESFPHEPTLITPLSKKLYNNPYYSNNLTLALPFLFKSSILNEHIQKSLSDSFYNLILINLNNLSIKKHQWAKNKKKDFGIFSSQSHEYIKKHLKHTNRRFSLYFKDKYSKTNNITPINHLKTARYHMNKDLKNLININESSSKEIPNSLFSRNILLKKSDSLKNHYNIGSNEDKIVNTVLKSELNGFNNLKIHTKELSYYYPEMEHQKTFQTEIVKQKILEKDQGFQDSNNSIPDIDVNKMADQVYSIIERKIKIERERRGLFV